MMLDIPEMFATVTGLLEDMHDVSVEGQRSDNPPELQQGLLACLKSGASTLDGHIAQIANALNVR